MEPDSPSISPLLGRPNAENLLAAAAAGVALGFAPSEIAASLSSVAVVPGRLERIENDRGLTVLVDYAHKPAALEGVLRTVRPLAQAVGGRVVVVFGCGGDRDRAKRPVMGRIACELADDVVVTSDNPRSEDADSIIAEVLAGVPAGKRVVALADRRAAIAEALRSARRGDVVLVAGKGHETAQVIGRVEHPFDDRVVASRAPRRGRRPMIPWLLHPFFGKVPVLGVFRYITFRAANAALMALLLAIFLGPSLIRWLRARQIGQSIREEGPKAHQAKAGTPTMGGVLINLAIVVPTILFADLTNRYVWVALGATVLAMLIGVGDDWRKVSRKQNRGLLGTAEARPAGRDRRRGRLGVGPTPSKGVSTRRTSRSRS